MAEDSKIGKLEDEALKRKERLKAYKRKIGTDDSEKNENGESDHKKIELPKYIIFTIYGIERSIDYIYHLIVIPVLFF